MWKGIDHCMKILISSLTASIFSRVKTKLGKLLVTMIPGHLWNTISLEKPSGNKYGALLKEFCGVDAHPLIATERWAFTWQS